MYRLSDITLLFQDLIVRLVQLNSIGKVLLPKVDQFLCDCQDGLVPFALDIVGSLVVDGSEDFAGVENAVRHQIGWIEVMIGT